MLSKLFLVVSFCSFRKLGLIRVLYMEIENMQKIFLFVEGHLFSAISCTSPSC